ncbi:hypothetical protein LINPERHAP1_LOCUS19754 [Linum perenne]
MAKKQQKSEGGQSFGVQKDKGKGIQKERVRRTRSSSRVKGSENPKTPTTAKTSKKRKEKPTPPDSDTDFDIPLNVHRKKKAPAVAEPAVKKRAAVQHNNVKLATLKKSIEECQDGNAFSRMYILHSLGTLLVPGNSWKISLNYEKYLNEEFSLIGQLNWGKYVVDTLLMGLDDFQSKLSYPSGDFNFLVVSVKEFSYGTIMAQVAAWEEVEAKRLLSLSDSIVAQRMA